MQKWRRSHNRVVEKVQWWSNVSILRGWSTIWRTNYATEALLQEWKFWSLAMGEEPWENLSLKVTGVWPAKEFHKTRGNKNSTLRGHTQGLVCTGPRKKSVPSQETAPDLSASIGGYPMKDGVGTASECSLLQGQKHWWQYFWEYSLARALLEVTIFSPRPGLTQ